MTLPKIYPRDYEEVLESINRRERELAELDPFTAPLIESGISGLREQTAVDRYRKAEGLAGHIARLEATNA